MHLIQKKSSPTKQASKTRQSSKPGWNSNFSKLHREKEGLLDRQEILKKLRAKE